MADPRTMVLFGVQPASIDFGGITPQIMMAINSQFGREIIKPEMASASNLRSEIMAVLNYNTNSEDIYFESRGPNNRGWSLGLHTSWSHGGFLYNPVVVENGFEALGGPGGNFIKVSPTEVAIIVAAFLGVEAVAAIAPQSRQEFLGPVRRLREQMGLSWTPRNGALEVFSAVPENWNV